MLSDELNHWTLTTLPVINRAIIGGRDGPDTLAQRLAGSVLADLPAPEGVPPAEARRLVVLLGLIGASVGRHYQEQDVARKAWPERGLDPVLVGPGEVPFLGYFRRLATATGTGHCGRDSYVSLVRWNAPTTVVRIGEVPMTIVPGVFGDAMIRTYTDDPGEVAFFGLLKKSEALELAANDLLQPISDGDTDIRSTAALRRVGMATLLLRALRRLNIDFAFLPVAAGGLRPDHFMDVFRQFAVHWTVGDVPPSGAQDPEFLRRDLLLGIDYPGYHQVVARTFPVLLEGERASLAAQSGVTPLPAMLLRSLGLDATTLAAMPVAKLREALPQHPALGAWYLLLAANARFAATHLMLTQKFLFNPQAGRDLTGAGDNPLVSNRRGTTGMDLPILQRLAQARQHHPLASIARVPPAEVARLARLAPVRAISHEDVEAMVRFAS